MAVVADTTSILSPLIRVTGDFVRTTQPFYIQGPDANSPQGYVTTIPLARLNAYGATGSLTVTDRSVIRITDFVQTLSGKCKIRVYGFVNYAPDTSGDRLANIFFSVYDTTQMFDEYLDDNGNLVRDPWTYGLEVEFTTISRGALPATSGQGTNADFSSSFYILPERLWNKDYEYHIVLAGSQSSPSNLRLIGASINIEIFRGDTL